MPRVEYPYEFTVSLRYDETGAVVARYVVRLLVFGGVRRRWAVALQVLRKDGRFRDIVRYDDWHDQLHRHEPGYPPGRMVLVEPIPGVDAVNQAIDDLRRHADEFIVAVAKYDDLEVLDDGLEVLDDDESPTGC